MSEEIKVAAEVAEAEFQRFLEAMDLTEKVERKGLSQEDMQSLEETKATVIAAMKRGRLVIDEDGCPVYTPKSGGDAIRFHEPTGATLQAMDKFKKGQDMAKTFAVLAAMTKQSIGRFQNMPNRDLSVCQAIMVLFLA